MKSVKLISLATAFLCMVNVQFGFGQDVEGTIRNIKQGIKDKKVEIKGNINASSMFNAISGIDQRRDPFSWNISGNINLNIAGIINAPFSIYISPGNKTYNVPSYRFTGLSPKYKWATLHLGDRSMNFSRYSFAGHSFFGVGLELDPGKVSVMGMYGRLQRARPEDINVRQSIEPAFKRMAYGTKISYDSGNEEIAFSLFHAFDDINSIPPLMENANIKPANNTILGLEFGKSFGDKVSFDMELAYSAYNRDVSTAKSEELTGLKHTMLGLFKPTESANFRSAINTSVNFLLNPRTTFSIGFERVDPQYTTLGSLFFNNDYENYTGAIATNIANGKITLAFNGGIQKNNLDGKQLNAANRFIGSVNANFMVSKRLNINTSYSNFRNTNRIRFIESQPDLPFDSLILAQVNQNMNLSVMYALSEDKSTSLIASVAYQNADQIEDDIVLTDRNTTYYLGNMSLQKTLKEKQMSMALSFQASLADISNQRNMTLSPTFTIRKAFFDKKMSASLSTSYINQFLEGEFANSVINVISTVRYQVSKKHNLGLSMRFANRGSQAQSGKPAFNEFMGRLNYGMSF